MLARSKFGIVIGLPSEQWVLLGSWIDAKFSVVCMKIAMCISNQEQGLHVMPSISLLILKLKVALKVQKSDYHIPCGSNTPRDQYPPS